MIAFVASFFVVASSQLVAVINQGISQAVLLLLVVFLFLLLAGSFNKDEEYYLKGGWNGFLMVLVFIGILLIFLNAIGWLGGMMGFISSQWSSASISGLILVIVIVLIMYFITKDSNSTNISSAKAKAKKEET